MKQFPSNLKYKKYHKINDSFLTLLDKKNFFLIKGQFGIQSLEAGKLTFKNIESCRRTIKRGLRKKGDIFIRVFTSIPVTKKPIAVRMGKGKGNISFWIAPIRKGQVLFEVDGVFSKNIYSTLKKAISKLPLKTRILKLKY